MLRWRPYARLAAVTLGLTLGMVGLGGCGSCADGGRATEAEGDRVWGRNKDQAQVAARAREGIDARDLTTPAVRKRVLAMPLPEVAARVGALEYRALARFKVERRGQQVEIVEDTQIEFNGLGEWHVVQRDADSHLLREKYAVHGLFYVRNGNGKLRLQGVADDDGQRTLKQAYSPLGDFTSWFGPRLELTPSGTGLVGERATVRYRFRLGPGPELVQDPNRPSKRLRPRALSGQLQVDADTGAPLAVVLRGQLDVAPPGDGGEWGSVEVELKSTIRGRADAPIVVSDAIEPIARRPVDLDPLGFLEGAVRTSTVIGGR